MPSRRMMLLLATLGALTAQGNAQSVQYKSRAGIEYRAEPDSGPIARAQAALTADPSNVQLMIALGVAQSGASQFQEAIRTFTRGIALAPQTALLYRWRGHRFISTRQFDKALIDLTQGAKLDPNIYGIWYHLGIARYAKGDFTGAAAAFTRAQPIAPDAGELAGATDWLWMSLSRAGKKKDADAMLARRIDSLPTTVAYAKRLKLYRGELKPDAVITSDDYASNIQIATLAYGIGNWYLVNGDKVKAKEWFERSVKSTGWQAFGFIMSEIDLRRVR